MVTERRTIGKTLSDLLGFMVDNFAAVVSMMIGYTIALMLLYRDPYDLSWTTNRAGFLAIIPTVITCAVWKPSKERSDELKATLRRQERELDELRRERDESEGG